MIEDMSKMGHLVHSLYLIINIGILCVMESTCILKNYGLLTIILHGGK